MTETQIETQSQNDPAKLFEVDEQQQWAVVAGDADTVEGGDLERGDILIGIPLAITGATLRTGDYPHGVFKDGKLIDGTGCGEKHPYANLSVTTGTTDMFRKALRRGRITAEQAGAVDPLESLVFNEAGTGLYRQFMEYLEARGILVFPEGPSAGSFGESRYDTLPHQWTVTDQAAADGSAEIRFDNDGNSVYTFRVKLVCPRGLRASDYQNEYTKQGRTRYFG